MDTKMVCARLYHKDVPISLEYPDKCGGCEISQGTRGHMRNGTQAEAIIPYLENSPTPTV